MDLQKSSHKDDSEMGASSERKRDLSPWNDRKPRDQVTGWKGGSGITSAEVKDHLQKNREARHQYRGAKKAMTRAQTKEVLDPLVGLPPTWQAFYSTVPHIDPKPAYKDFVMARTKGGKRQREGDSSRKGRKEVEEDEDALEAELKRAVEERKVRKKAWEEAARSVTQWEQKVDEMVTLDRQEEKKLVEVSRKVGKVSYELGILQGKFRSSNVYFKLLLDDLEKNHQKKVFALTRSCSLMQKEMSDMTTDVLKLIAEAEERAPTTPRSQTQSDAESKDPENPASLTGM